MTIEDEKRSRGINPAIQNRAGRRVLECLASSKVGGFTSVVVECGHIGCCDSSPNQHASKHAAATGHPIITSFEPGEDWFFDYETQGTIKGVELLPPPAHPKVSPYLDPREGCRPTGSRSSTRYSLSGSPAPSDAPVMISCQT